VHRALDLTDGRRHLLVAGVANGIVFIGSDDFSLDAYTSLG